MKRKGFWVASGLLIIPVIVFYVLNTGIQNFKKLPILGERIAPDGLHQKDTLFYSIPDFHVSDQTGKVVTQADFNNKIYVANFFFTRCKEVCPTMNRRLSMVYEKYKEFIEVKFISFSVDPENDSTPVLNNYSKKYKADPKIWHFVNGNMDSIINIAQGFLLPVSIENKTIDHSQQLILVDKQNRIRGIYDSSSEAEVLQLEDDLKVLLYEYHNPRSG